MFSKDRELAVHVVRRIPISQAKNTSENSTDINNVRAISYRHTHTTTISRTQQNS